MRLGGALSGADAIGGRDGTGSCLGADAGVGDAAVSAAAGLGAAFFGAAFGLVAGFGFPAAFDWGGVDEPRAGAAVLLDFGGALGFAVVVSATAGLFALDALVFFAVAGLAGRDFGFEATASSAAIFFAVISAPADFATFGAVVSAALAGAALELSFFGVATLRGLVAGDSASPVEAGALALAVVLRGVVAIEIPS